MQFHKMDGAGNDFILIDARHNGFHLSPSQIAHLCHRRLGIGADGFMLLSTGPQGSDFRMEYYNSDGYPADMCGNGGRCIALFAHLLGLSHSVEGKPHLHFVANDGIHHAVVLLWDPSAGIALVQLGMRDVPCNGVRRVLDGWLLNTGVPHYVQRVQNLDAFDVVGEGRRLRHAAELGPEGANVNFIEDLPDGRLALRTYERGVEDETLACGTGVTACAIVTGNGSIHARGGDFKVAFTPTGTAYTDITLTAPVSCNFVGDFDPRHLAVTNN